MTPSPLAQPPEAVDWPELSPATRDDAAIPRHLFWQLQVLGWSGFSLLGFLFSSSFLNLHEALTIVPLRAFFGITITSALRPAYRWLRGVSLHIGIKAISVFLASGAITFVDGYLLMKISWAFPWLDPDVIQRFLLKSSSLRWLIFCFWGLLYLGIHYWLQTRHTKLHLARLEAAARASELQLLRAQINPHFLFNALNSILAEAKNPRAVTSLTQSLSNYLRFSLQQKGHVHELGVELDALQDYLLVEKTRFEENLEYTIRADTKARGALIPIALVQTLIDNALKYGQYSTIRPVRVEAVATVENAMLSVQVANSGEWVTNSSSTGTGIANLKRRLQLLYGENAGLAFQIEPGRVIATVHLPAVFHEEEAAS